MTPTVAPGSSRRRFLTAFIAISAAAIPASLAALAGRFLLGIRAGKNGSRTLALGSIADFPCGGAPVERILEYSAADGYFRSDRRERIYIVHDGDSVRALSATCSHLGCGVSWDASAGLFRCPCHGGTYHRDGTVAGGPPPRPLTAIATTISDGKLTVTLPEEA